MSSTETFERDASRKDYRAPFSNDHPIPTVQKYREHQHELKEQTQQAEDSQHTEEDDSKEKRAYNAVKSIWKNEDKENAEGNPYPTANQNDANESNHEAGEKDSSIPDVPSGDRDDGATTNEDGDSKDNGKKGKGGNELSATEKSHGHMDPKQKRKDMKHNKREDGGREVTDPVTHLPLSIRDSTAKDLRRAPENHSGPDEKLRKTDTGLSGASKSSSQLETERKENQDGYYGMQKTFPPPSFDDTKAELVKLYQFALTVGLGAILILVAFLVILVLFITRKSWWDHHKFEVSKASLTGLVVTISVASGAAIAILIGLRDYLGKKVESVWEDEVWDAARTEENEIRNSNTRLPESVSWMNSLLTSVWPLINPDLFASIVDMLEDVMQASLPKVIRMVSIDDLGQGSESIRILGVRWLPTGAADQSVDEEGNIKSTSDKETNDRAAPGEGEEEEQEDKAKEEDESESKKRDHAQEKAKEEEQQAIRQGMEAEQGDFVNMELAFAYRARPSGKSIKSKAKNAHLYLKFYLPGGVFVPVWVELRGLIGTMRLRLQLAPDPPFFSLCTLTFVGQPKADLSCVPLSKHLPNLMNVPLISSFVQASIDAALADYVAPKSLTLDLKDMLVGDDFKKDTVARGVIVIFIKKANGFKEGDGGIGPMKGKSDSYITCSWGKFGKTISSTRVIEDDQDPIWDEWAYMLVAPEEINADEKLRLQLWDSDKYTADDDLGRVEVDLKELMHSPKTKNKMNDREDRFMGEDAGEKMPGTLFWSVGYYEKTRISEERLAKQTDEESIDSKEQLKNDASKGAARKLREARAHDESKEIRQQALQDYKERENKLICSSPPDQNYPSGILSIQIHNITGLEVEALQKRHQESDGPKEEEDEAEQNNDIPSSYCTIILNHQNVYMTRTKPKNAKPFFNAVTERFIRDWRNSEIMISVRDSREGELDPLLGIIYLPLAKIFNKKSQVMEMFPLVGGIGFGRARISLMFRSVELQMPAERLGWDLGTLEIKAPIIGHNLQKEIANHRIKIRSNTGRVKMTTNDNGEWLPKHGSNKSAFLPVRKRYAMPLVLEFRTSSFGPDRTPAFAVFWLQDIPDEQEKSLALKVWAGGKENLKRATTCADYDGLEDDEKSLGEIELTIKFWRGLSGYHKKYSQKSKSKDMRNVMEALDTVHDEIQSSGSEDSSSGSDSDSDSDSDTGGGGGPSTKLDPEDTPQSSSEDSHTKNPIKMVKNLKHQAMEGKNDSKDGERGIVGTARDYKSHHKQLHRKHRGLMQWRVARTGQWAADKAKQVKGEVKGVFEHSEKGGSGVETEV